MESALEYLAAKRESLANDYRTPDGKYSESCGLIAVDIAKRLLNEGKTPHIAMIQGKVVDSVGNRESIVPIAYEGSWGAHQVCCAEDLAYDPMVGEIVPISDYCERAFEGEVDMGVLVAEDRIEEFVNRF